MNASSSATVKRTKQTLVLISKRPSVGQEYNFINIYKEFHMMSSHNTQFLQKREVFCIHTMKVSEGEDGG
jgi:hypothetical protein